MAAAGVGGGALVIAGVGAFVASESDPAGGAATRDGQWGVDLPDQDALAGEAPGIACLPEGCELWAVEAPVENRPLVSDELVVVVGEEEIVAYETSTGETRWRVPTPTGAEDPSPNLVALSARGLAMLPADPDAPAGEPGSVGAGQLELYDAANGSHRSELDLGLDEAREVSWYGDRLVVAGTRAGQPTVVGVAPDGQVLWEHEGRETTALRSEGVGVLLETDGTDVVGVDPATGEQRWHIRGEPMFPEGGPTDTLLVLDPHAGQAQLVDVEQGTVEQRFPASEATIARRMGPWVTTGNAELIRIHDVDTGEELLRHEIPIPDEEGYQEPAMPLTQVSWQQIDDLMVVAWPPASGQQDAEVVVYRRDGRQVRTIDVDVHAWPHLLLEAVNHWEATVFASASGTAESQTSGRTIFAIDVHEGQVEEVGQGIEQVVAQHDEIVTIRNDNGVRVYGPAGEIDIIHGRRLAASRPLIAYGSDGLIRLDPGMLGFSEPRGP